MLRKLLGYAAYMFGANTFTALLTFAVTTVGLVTRPKEAIGDFAIYMLVYEVGVGCLINGVNASVQTLGADSRENRMRFTKMLYLLFPVMLLLFGSIGIGLSFVLGPWIAFSLVGLPWVVVYWWGRYIVRSRLDAKREAALLVVASLSNSGFTFLFLTFTDLRDAMIYGDFAALVASGLAAMVMLPRGIDAKVSEIIKVDVPREFLRGIYKTTVPLWWAGQVFTIKIKLQKAWTAAMLGKRAMGAIGAYEMMWQFAAKPIEYLGQAALPGLVSAKEERDILYRELLRFVLVMLPIVGICVAGGLPLLFTIIDYISEYFGRTSEPLSVRYAEVLMMVLIASLAIPGMAVEMVTNQYSVAVGRQRTVLYAQLVNISIMAITLYPLASRYGLLGVMATGVFGETFNAMTFIIVLWKKHRQCMRSALIWGALAFLWLTVAIGLIYYFKQWEWNWVITFPAIAIFVVGMVLVRLIEVEDFRRMMKAYRRMRGLEPKEEEDEDDR